MTAERAKSNLPGALSVLRALFAACRRFRPPSVRPIATPMQGIPAAPQESQQDGSAVLLSHGGGRVGKCSRCGTSLGGYLVKAAADGTVHLACPTPRQIARRERMGR
jgi:hypothetical protein